MKWRKETAWNLISDTGHRVSKSLINRQAKYTAWAPKQRQPIGIYNNAEEAKQQCELNSQETAHIAPTTKQ